MKKNNLLVTIIIILIFILTPTLILPTRLFGWSSYIPKLFILLFFGFFLLILLLINYKELKIDKKDILILIFLGLVYISTIFSSNLKVSIIGAERKI